MLGWDTSFRIREDFLTTLAWIDSFRRMNNWTNHNRFKKQPRETLIWWYLKNSWHQKYPSVRLGQKWETDQFFDLGRFFTFKIFINSSSRMLREEASSKKQCNYQDPRLSLFPSTALNHSVKYFFHISLLNSSNKCVGNH